MRELTVDVGPLVLQDGTRLQSVLQRVTTYGDPQLPAVFVAHALTGSSRIWDWWPELVGEGKIFDPQRHYVIGINALGGCYGSTGPSAIDPFPHVTVKDVVAAQMRALEHLGVPRLSLAIGASLGGMQALQWAVDYPDRLDRAVIIGAHDHQPAMGIAFNAIQRDVVALHATKGLRIARKIAMLSYKSEELFTRRHGRNSDRKARFRFDVEGYLEHQADLFEERMDPRSYVTLTHAMDSFDVRDAAAASDSPELLFVGISSDRLFPAKDVRAAAARFAQRGFRCRYAEIESDHGHDAFLAEPHLLNEILAEPVG